MFSFEVKVWGGRLYKRFVAYFLEVPLSCLGSMTAAVQPKCLWNSEKTCYKPPYIIFYTIILCASSPLYKYIVPYIGKI